MLSIQEDLIKLIQDGVLVENQILKEDCFHERVTFQSGKYLVEVHLRAKDK